MAEDPNAWWATRKDLSLRNLLRQATSEPPTVQQKCRLVWVSFAMLVVSFLLIGLIYVLVS